MGLGIGWVTKPREREREMFAKFERKKFWIWEI